MLLAVLKLTVLSTIWKETWLCLQYNWCPIYLGSSHKFIKPPNHQTKSCNQKDLICLVTDLPLCQIRPSTQLIWHHGLSYYLPNVCVGACVRTLYMRVCMCIPQSFRISHYSLIWQSVRSYLIVVWQTQYLIWLIADDTVL